MTLFDTHAHLLDEQFDEDRNALIPALSDAGVAYVVEAATCESDFPRIHALTALYDHIYGAVGVHPHSAHEITDVTYRHIAQLLTKPKIVAVGEIGLDYHYDFSPRDEQKAAFDAQLSIAGNAHKPVIIHDREAHGDTMELVSAHRTGLVGVMHCYSGSYEDAMRYIDMGLYIAFGGALTFKNAVKQRDVASRLPLERLLVETDCPYMTPEPHRGNRNDPRLIHLAVEKLAEVRNISVEEAARATTENAKRLFLS